MLMRCSALTAFLRMQTRDHAPDTPSNLASGQAFAQIKQWLPRSAFNGLLQDLPAWLL